MRALDLLGGAEIIPEQDCWDMLASESVGRIAFTADGQVEIFPVNFGLDGHGIIFRTNAGRKMIWASAGEVAFEVDSIDAHSRSGWSVVVHGTASDMTQIDEAAGGLAAQPWTGTKDFLVRITPRTVTGRRVGTGTSNT